MQNDTAKNMAKTVVGSLRELMGDGASSFYIDGLSDSERTFTVKFVAYNYFWVSIGSERGGIMASLMDGDRYILLDGFDGWWEKINLEEWVPKLAEEIKLRIPDKYLKAKGYL